MIVPLAGAFALTEPLTGVARFSAAPDQSWTYDPIGRLASTGWADAGVNSVSWSFERNPASQIWKETQSNDAYSWNAFATVDRDYQTNGLNQYTTAGSASFTYDANGNLTSDGAKSYLYDVENRLVKVTEGAYVTNLYYDPLGRLVKTSSNAPGFGTITYLHDGDALVAEYNSAGTMLQRHVHGPAAGVDDPLVTYSGTSNAITAARFLYADPRGSIVYSATSTNGAAVINTYDVYGIPGTTNTGRFQYTGQVWLPEIGLYYYKARIYSPSLGRFLQTDPIGYADNLNLYSYVIDDPVNAVDFTGMCTGSRLTNDSGMCSSTGTPTTGMAFGGPRRGKDGNWSYGDKRDDSGTPGIGHNGPPSSTDQIEAEAGGMIVVSGPTEPRKCGIFCKIGRALGIYEIGAVGERRVREVWDIGEKVRIPAPGGYRIPDGMTETTLSEVKNVGKLSLTAQLRVFLSYSQENGLEFVLYVLGSTDLSTPLVDLVAKGDITLRYIPGTSND